MNRQNLRFFASLQYRQCTGNGVAGQTCLLAIGLLFGNVFTGFNKGICSLKIRGNFITGLLLNGNGITFGNPLLYCVTPSCIGF